MWSTFKVEFNGTKQGCSHARDTNALQGFVTSFPNIVDEKQIARGN